MVLADTSVWIEHLKRRVPRMEALLLVRSVHQHEFVVGELACGTVPRRSEFFGFLNRLPALPRASHAEAMALLNSRELSGHGLGWIDVHLLAAAIVSGVRVWTLDKRLAAAALTLGVGLVADDV